MILFIILAILPAFFHNSIQAGEIISTSFGKVEGSTATSRDGRLFYQFLGIPYAKAERFQPPTNPDSWTDVKNASANGQRCPQILVTFEDTEPKVFAGSEDCLNLNVFTPVLPQPDKTKILLPVIVWFHGGGGGVAGAADFDPQYFMDTDIVLVTFDARLGFLGYLNLGIEQAQGNQRLKDQVQMLKWVQKNIENFGGDPTRVTLNGEDSGGAEIGYHMISPLSAGLFAGAITHDGVAITPYMFIRNPMQQAKNFGKEVGCQTDTKSMLYECLKGKDVKDLVLPFHRWTSNITDQDFIKFGPSAEFGNYDGKFLTENPYVSIREGRIANKVPWLSTFGLNAGTPPFVYKVLREASHRERLNKIINTTLPMYLDYDVTAKDSLTVTKKIMEHYFEGYTITEKNALQFVKVVTDGLFTLPNLFQVGLYNKHAPTYALAFKYVPMCSLAKTMGYGNEIQGGCLDVVSYQFPLHSFGYCGIDKSSVDYELSKNFVQMLASFAENGKPTKLWGATNKWRPYNTDEDVPFIYSIETTGSTQEHEISTDFRSRTNFWNDLYKTELNSEIGISAVEKF